MSENKPTWVDYASLGANIVQIGQLSGVRRRLESLAQIEAAREERARLENDLRQFVFESEERLENISKYQQKAPAGVYVAVSILETAFNEIGIVPATFQQFVDKDRVKHVRSILEALRADAAHSMAEEELRQTDRMLGLVSQMSELEELIAHYETKEKLAETDKKLSENQDELNKLSKGKGSPYLPWFLMGAVGLVLLFIIGGNSSSIGYSISCLMMVVAILGGVVVAVRPSELKDLRRERTKLQQLRTRLQQQILPASKLDMLYGIFGEKSTVDAYISMRDNCLADISRVTENDREGKPLPESILDMVFPARLLEQEQVEQKEEMPGDSWRCPNCGGINSGNRTSCLGCNTPRKW
jgi:hypothetical protein